MQEQITFNDLPEVLHQVLLKVERLERMFDNIKNEIDKRNTVSNDHIPMTIDETCLFLKMKKSTLYYHIQQGNIPATKRGKNYILFKDEIIQWLESGRKNPVVLTAEEENALFCASHRRKPNARIP